MPNDAQRLKWLSWLIENGYGSQIVISHDIDAKYLLLRYGGSGYAHIVNNIVPRMRSKGFEEHQIYARGFDGIPIVRRRVYAWCSVINR